MPCLSAVRVCCVLHGAIRDKLGPSYQRSGMTLSSGELLEYVTKVHRSVMKS